MSSASTSAGDIALAEWLQLSIDDIRVLLDAVQDMAIERRLCVCVAVVDHAGNHAGMLRHPEAFLTSTNVALAKAFTAANFRTATEKLADQIPAETRADLAAVDRRLTFIRGGLPVLRGGELVGGIGVSGASSQEDADLAAAALVALATRGEG
jgi:glc operon protein GlcG